MSKSKGIGRGGKRAGAGRPKGSTNPYSQAELARLRAQLLDAYERVQNRSDRDTRAAELLPMILRKLTDIERHLRLVETPAMPRATRRAPLAG